MGLADTHALGGIIGLLERGDQGNGFRLRVQPGGYKIRCRFSGENRELAERSIGLHVAVSGDFNYFQGSAVPTHCRANHLEVMPEDVIPEEED